LINSRRSAIRILAIAQKSYRRRERVGERGKESGEEGTKGIIREG